MSKALVKKAVNGDAHEERKKSPSRSKHQSPHQHHLQDVDTTFRLKKLDKSDKTEVIVDKNKKQLVNEQLNEVKDLPGTLLRPPRSTATRRCISDSISVSAVNSESDVQHSSAKKPVGKTTYKLTPLVPTSIPSKQSVSAIRASIEEQSKLDKDIKQGTGDNSDLDTKSSGKDKKYRSPRRKPEPTHRNMQGGKGNSPQAATSKDTKDVSAVPHNVDSKVSVSKIVENSSVKSVPTEAKTECSDIVNDKAVIKAVDSGLRSAPSEQHSEAHKGGVSNIQQGKLDVEEESSTGLHQNLSAALANSTKETDVDQEAKSKKKDEDVKQSRMSPDHRFMKLDEEVGRGSFKTVHKGLEIDTGVHVAWCELQVSNALIL